jgi:hypothetical protein
MGTHHTGQRTLIGDGQGGIAEGIGSLYQLLRKGGAAQETEIGDTVQLGIGRQYRWGGQGTVGLRPCRWHGFGGGLFGHDDTSKYWINIQYFSRHELSIAGSLAELENDPRKKAGIKKPGKPGFS